MNIYAKLTKFSLALLFLFSSLSFTANAEKYASIVVDVEHGRVLHARFADDPRYPASITKVMTIYMVFDALEAGQVMLTDEMTVSEAAASQPPSKLGLKAGTTISIEDAIRALVTKSANDVAVVVAEHLGTTETRFATLMTAKARKLGLTDTRFKNASGLHNSGQSSTARDLAKLGEAIMKRHARYFDYFAVREFSYANRRYRNHNRLLDVVSGVDGIKTGFTRASGYNLLATAKRDGRRIIAVMLGGETSKSRNEHVTDLLDAAFNHLSEASEEEALAQIDGSIVSQDPSPDTHSLNSAELRSLRGTTVPVEEGDAQY